MRRYILLFILCTTSLLASVNAQLKLTLDDAIQMALNNAKEKKISNLHYEIAKSQYEQALSALYPIWDLNLTAMRKDEATNFALQGNVAIPEPVATTIGANALPIDTKILYAGRDSVVGSLDLTYPLYTGGKIDSIIRQAQLNQYIAKQSVELTYDEIVFNVKKLYLGYIMAYKLHEDFSKHIQKMMLTQELAGQLYKNESLNVKKTDFLDVKMELAFLRGKFATIKQNLWISKAALANMIGMPNDMNIVLSQTQFDEKQIVKPQALSLWLESSLKNKNIKQMQYAVEIANERVKEAKAQYLPQVGLFANASAYSNSEEGGYNTSENADSWRVGLKATVNLFSGFKDEQAIVQKRLKKQTIQQKKELLEERIALKTRMLHSLSNEYYESIHVFKEAYATAIENRTLNIKAYRVDLAKTKDVLEAQLKELKTKVLYTKALYNYFLTQAEFKQLSGEQE